MSKSISSAELINWPSGDVDYQFSFTASCESGSFGFLFRWFNDRWNCWVTLPDGTVRSCAVYPNVVSWTGYLDYGIVFSTDLESIGYDSLFMTELYLLTWQ